MDEFEKDSRHDEEFSAKSSVADAEKGKKGRASSSVVKGFVICLACVVFFSGLGFALPMGFDYVTAKAIGMVRKGRFAYMNKNSGAEKDTVQQGEEDLSEKSLSEGDLSPLGLESRMNAEIIAKAKKSVVCVSASSQRAGLFGMNYNSDGSGIIFSKDGKNAYIVTNNHVIDSANWIYVSFDSKNVVDAKVVGKDELNDLAVISVSLLELERMGISDVEPIVFGNSDEVKNASMAIAIGNAFGEGNIATLGIVSAVNKEVVIDSKRFTVIQTDAAINVGNDGGALINSKGQVIGINTSKISRSSVEGVGYSITSNSAKNIIEKIMNKETSPFLGVYITDITEDMIEQLDFPMTGVVITDIVPNSSAADANLAKGDCITGIDESPIFGKEQLIDAVAEHKVGDVIKLRVFRGGKAMTVSVRLKSGE